VVMTLFALFLWHHIDWIKQRNQALEAEWAIDYPDSMYPTTPRAPGLLWLFGEQGYAHLVLDTGEHPNAVKEARSLFPEAALSIGSFFTRNDSAP
jgi:hypothetical protein